MKEKSHASCTTLSLDLYVKKGVTLLLQIIFTYFSSWHHIFISRVSDNGLRGFINFLLFFKRRWETFHSEKSISPFAFFPWKWKKKRKNLTQRMKHKKSQSKTIKRRKWISAGVKVQKRHKVNLIKFTPPMHLSPGGSIKGNKFIHLPYILHTPTPLIWTLARLNRPLRVERQTLPSFNDGRHWFSILQLAEAEIRWLNGFNSKEGFGFLGFCRVATEGKEKINNRGGLRLFPKLSRPYPTAFI